MKIANLDGRLALVVSDRALDVHEASKGEFDSDPQRVFDRWHEFVTWSRSAPSSDGVIFDRSRLGPPAPRPGQIFAIGVNYVEHAAEAGYPPDSDPVTFTKFPSCLAGADTVVELPTETVDWEVELVVVIGGLARGVQREDAWSHVAGLTIGQDLSERTAQLTGSKPQFSLAKSHAGFGPTGPWLVTPDEFDDPDDLAISCELSGEAVQDSRTSRMIYDIPELIVRLSAVCPLRPGDVIFTGTPAGVGNARTPKKFITDRDVLTSRIEGIGEIRQSFRSSSTPRP